MTEESRAAEFAKDTDKRNQLASLLKHPVLLEAIDIVEELMEPQTGTQADAVPAIAAAKMHQVAGANELLKKLRNLSKEPKELKRPRGREMFREETEQK